MSSLEERRRHPRFASSARILWRPIDDDFLQMNRLRDVSQQGALVVTESIPALGTEILFEFLGDDQVKVASGRARVVWINPAGGMGIEFIEVELGEEEVERLSEPPAPGELLPDLSTLEFITDGVEPLPEPPRPPPSAEPTSPPSQADPAPLPAAAPAADSVPAAAPASDPLAAPSPMPAPEDGAPFTPPPPSPPPAAFPQRTSSPELQIQLETAARGAGVTVGIDLGTTNTCTAYFGRGKTRIVPARTGANTTPSMINIGEDGKLVVGHRAADRHVLSPVDTVYGWKRLLGRTFREDVASDLQPHFAYPIREADGQRYGALLGERVLSMREIARLVLEDIRLQAEEHLGTRVEAAVITVPAYFNEAQRDAVREAARSAHIAVRRIVNEPTAAAVAWGYGRDLKARLAVWDLGGGTFDFTVVDVDGHNFEVMGTGGDNFLGGIDFDDLVASWILERFLKTEETAFEPTPQQLVRLKEAAEEAKRALSVQSSYTVSLPNFLTEPARDLQVEMTRQQLDGITAPLIERTITLADEVLASCGVLPTDVDEVLLVGGMTRVPAIQRAVEALFERAPSRRVNPDEAVAIGAALLASQADRAASPTLVDVLPLSLGFAESGRRYRRIIARNTRVPIERSLVVPVDGDASSIEIPLFQGEDPDATRDDYLCTVIVDELPPAGAGGRRVELALSLDEQCVLSVRAVDGDSGAELRVHVDHSRDAAGVLEGLGEYTGSAGSPRWRPPSSHLRRVFGKLRGLFGE